MVADVKCNVAIVIVTYNSASDIVECVASLFQRECPKWPVIVVDNASTDSTLPLLMEWLLEQRSGRGGEEATISYSEIGCDVDLEEIRQSRSDVYIMRSANNIGFAAANNLGAKWAFKNTNADFIWFLNPDAIAEAGAGLELLLEISQGQSVGIVGSTLRYYDRPEVIQAVGVEYNVMTTIGRELGNGSRSISPEHREAVLNRMTYVVGASMMVSKRFFDDVGYMSEDYFLYYEEMDWARRAKGKYKLSWAPNSVVLHKEGGSIGTSSRAVPSATSVFYMSRAMLIFYSKFYRLLLPVAVARLAFNLVRHVVGGNLSQAEAIVRGSASAAGKMYKKGRQ